MFEFSFARYLPFIAAFSGVVSQVNATIIPFDLQGNAGIGMLPGNQNPGAAGTGSGGEVGAGITYNDVSKVLTINVGWGSGNGFTDLTGTVTAAHIHSSAGFTVNGPVIISLDGSTPGFSNSATNGGWTGTLATLNASQETSLLAGQLYLNAHTAVNPGGEIRGNLVQVPEPTSLALLSLSGIALLRRRR